MDYTTCQDDVSSIVGHILTTASINRGTAPPMFEARWEALRGEISSVASAAVRKPAKCHMREIIMEEMESCLACSACDGCALYGVVVS